MVNPDNPFYDEELSIQEYSNWKANMDEQFHNDRQKEKEKNTLIKKRKLTTTIKLDQNIDYSDIYNDRTAKITPRELINQEQNLAALKTLRKKGPLGPLTTSEAVNINGQHYVWQPTENAYRRAEFDAHGRAIAPEKMEIRGSKLPTIEDVFMDAGYPTTYLGMSTTPVRSAASFNK